MASSVARISGLPAPLGNSIPYLALAGVAFLVYAGVYHNAFLYDDESLIVRNVYLRGWQHMPALFAGMLSAGDASANPYYRPIQLFLYLVVFQMAGLSTVAFHLLNVGLHAANAGLVWHLGRKFGFLPGAAFAAALLWVVHPVNTEAVTYMSATADVLQGFFCLLGIAVLLPDFAPRRMMAASLLMVLGLLSKETVVAFPLLAVTAVYFTSRKRFDLRSYLRLWPLFAVAAVYVVMHLLLAPQHPQAARIASESTVAADFAPFATLPLFLRLLLWPAGLHMEHDMPAYASFWHGPVLAGSAIAAAAVFLIQRQENRKLLPLAWGVLWFFAAHAPLILLCNKAYEHWLYLPSAGLFLGAAQSLALYIRGLSVKRARLVRRVAFVAVLVAAAGFGSLTYAQNRLWRDPEVFFGNTLAHSEAAPNFHINLGIAYARRGDYEKAVEQYRQAVDVKGGNALSSDNLAMVESDWGSTLLEMPGGEANADEALAHFKRALAADPDSYRALHALSKFYARQGDNANAILYGDKATAVRARFIDTSDTDTQEGQN